MNSYLLRSIDKIAFTQLKELNLCMAIFYFHKESNFIANVESISLIEAPLLEKLMLSIALIIFCKVIIA